MHLWQSISNGLFGNSEQRAAHCAYKNFAKDVRSTLQNSPFKAKFTKGMPADLRKGIGGAVVLGLMDQWESGAIQALPAIPDLIHPQRSKRVAAFDHLKKTLDLSVNLLSSDVSSLYRQFIDAARSHAEKNPQLSDILRKISELTYMLDHPNG